MLRDMRQLCERHGDVQPEDLRESARVLMERQFLLRERPRDREAYRRVANHQDYFTNLFDAIGWTLHRDDDFGMIGLLPTASESFARLKLVESLLILCLRLLYEEGMERFQVREGAVTVASEVLLGRYETLLGRPRPKLSEYREALVRLRRHSLVETGEADEDGLPMLRILPSVRLVAGHKVLERLAALAEVDDEPAIVDDEEIDA